METEVAGRFDDDELRASMQKSGWLELFPGYADENNCLIVGHRRMKIAQELGIKPVVKTITFGDGSDGAAKRLEAAIASNIGTATLTQRDRKRIAELAYQHGYTQKQIGDLLGVSQRQISTDIGDLEVTSKSPRAKTVTNPKGAGRRKRDKKDVNVALKPKQSKPQLPPPIKAVDAKNRVAGVDIKVDPVTWQAFNEIVQQEHKSATSKIGELVTSYVDGGEVRAELPKTSQEKVDVAIRQHQRKLDAAFESRVAEGVRKRIDEIVLPHWKQKLDDAERILNRRNGIMDKATFNAVRRGLHPDSRNAISTEKLAEAFDAFMRLEKLLLNEKDSPSDPSNIPSSLAEWDKMRVMDLGLRLQRHTERRHGATWPEDKGNKSKWQLDIRQDVIYIRIIETKPDRKQDHDNPSRTAPDQHQRNQQAAAYRATARRCRQAAPSPQGDGRGGSARPRLPVSPGRVSYRWHRLDGAHSGDLRYAQGSRSARTGDPRHSVTS